MSMTGHYSCGNCTTTWTLTPPVQRGRPCPNCGESGKVTRTDRPLARVNRKGERKLMSIKMDYMMHPNVRATRTTDLRIEAGGQTLDIMFRDGKFYIMALDALIIEPEVSNAVRLQSKRRKS